LALLSKVRNKLRKEERKPPLLLNKAGAGRSSRLLPAIASREPSDVLLEEVRTRRMPLFCLQFIGV
jgi:hypothetical protein